MLNFNKQFKLKTNEHSTFIDNFDPNSRNLFIYKNWKPNWSFYYNLLNICLTNRTFEKAEKIKKTFNDITVQKWGDIPEFDIVINATSVGLNKENFDLDLNKFGTNKFFYDVIYNPNETNFLKEAKVNGNKTENGRMMFIYQAHQSFALWNKVLPKIDEETIEILK